MAPKPHREDPVKVRQERKRVGEAEWEWVGFVSSGKRGRNTFKDLRPMQTCWVQRRTGSSTWLEPRVGSGGTTRLQVQICFSGLGGGLSKRHVQVCVLERALCRWGESRSETPGDQFRSSYCVWSIWEMTVVPTKVAVQRMKRERWIKELGKQWDVWHLESKYMGVRQGSWMTLGLFFDMGSWVEVVSEKSRECRRLNSVWGLNMVTYVNCYVLCSTHNSYSVRLLLWL